MEAGGYITNNRVNGSLAVTRAFGDFFYKKSGVISVPEINKV
jgi:serine/threonine protein phosphatase PrpC